MPAAQSFVPTIVTTANLRNALALNSSANQVASILRPSVGGIVYAIAEGLLGQNTGVTMFAGVAWCRPL